MNIDENTSWNEDTIEKLNMPVRKLGESLTSSTSRMNQPEDK